MRQCASRTWLILLLLAGLIAPAPRMAGHLLAGREPSTPTAQKRPAVRGLNRLGSPAPTGCVQDAACRVDAPEPPRPRRLAALRSWPRPLAPAPPAAPPAPISFRLRC